jgi:lysozyme
MIGSNKVIPMADFSRAINLICRYEGFNESAYPDVTTGSEPYTLGYGTQFYPDGSPVKLGQFCTKRKALEYLFHEIQVINEELSQLNLGLDGAMNEALISFIHSIGWESFLYSAIIDHIDNEDWELVTKEMMRWVFDQDHQIVGTLLDRRKDEIDLFLTELGEALPVASGILLAAFGNYTGSPSQQKAIEKLEAAVNPYDLSEFVNEFKEQVDYWEEFRTDTELEEYGLESLRAICDI